MKRDRISCSNYDLLELLALRKEVVRINHANGSIEKSNVGVIQTLSIKAGHETLTLASGLDIRLINITDLRKESDPSTNLWSQVQFC